MPAPQGKEWARDIPLEVKSVNSEAHTFRGLAAAWSLDLGNDVIHKGAFTRTLDHWKSSARRPVYLLNGHKSNDVRDVIGKMVDAVETDAGLETEWQFVPDDPTAEAAFKRVQGGFVTGMSIGYTPINPETEVVNGKRIRHLKEVKLHEVSLVVFPMNEDARIDMASVKTLAQWPDMNEDERKQYIATLSDDDRTALRALLAPAPEPGPALAPEELTQEARKALVRLNLQQLATRTRGSAPVGQNIATMSDRTDEHFRKAG
jgi:HK97 family phage prohead protease